MAFERWCLTSVLFLTSAGVSGCGDDDAPPDRPVPACKPNSPGYPNCPVPAAPPAPETKGPTKVADKPADAKPSEPPSETPSAPAPAPNAAPK